MEGPMKCKRIFAIAVTLFFCIAALPQTVPPKAVTSWLKKNAIRLTTVEAGSGFDDLKPLKAAIGKAHVVALGEGTHGTREFQLFKHRMFEFLVTKKGFTVFAMEAPFGEAVAVNDYVLNGTGDLDLALDSLVYWVWRTQEVRDMLAWMRQWNEDPAHENKIHFYGIDMQEWATCTAAFKSYIDEVDPDFYGSELMWVLETFSSDQNLYDYSSIDDDQKVADAAALANLLEYFDQKHADYAALSSEKAWGLARQNLRIVAQAQKFYCTGWSDVTAAYNMRDAFMAENVRWIMNYEGRQSRMALWAHNGHITGDPTAWWFVPMGYHLRQALGKDYMAVGLQFNQGSFLSMDCHSGPYCDGPISYSVGLSETGSLNQSLASAAIPLFMVDIRKVPASGKNGKWWHQAQWERWYDEAYDPSLDQDHGYYVDSVPTTAYNLLFFIESMTETTFLGWGARSRTSGRLGDPWTFLLRHPPARHPALGAKIP
jgi:erythromycin esterase